LGSKRTRHRQKNATEDTVEEEVATWFHCF
jgi:hypothetical protein